MRRGLQRELDDSGQESRPAYGHGQRRPTAGATMRPVWLRIDARFVLRGDMVGCPVSSLSYA